MPSLFDDPFSYTILAILAIGFLYVVYYQIRVRTKGTETEATVTQIVEKEAPDADTGVRRTYDIHVFYLNRKGEPVEAVLSNPNGPFHAGQKIRIRYVDSHPELPVCVSKEE